MDKTLAPSLEALPRSGRGLVKVRFVGGPWHNRLVEVAPRSRIAAEYIDADSRTRRIAKYFLCNFETPPPFGTRYAEYVCDNMFSADGDVLPVVAGGHEVVRLPRGR